MSCGCVAIIDSGGSNIASLQYALKRLDARAELTTDAQRIRVSSHVILPGVGAAADAMRRLRQTGLDKLIPTLKQPVLGICLGMQLLASRSEEQDTACLNVITGSSEKLQGTSDAPVPNMGWCPVTIDAESPLLSGIASGSHFYFLHSYALPVSNFSVATAQHTGPFTAILQYRNFFATQFHPERSASSGARLLHNFLRLKW